MKQRKIAQQLKRIKGHVLVEALIGIAVFSIGVLGLVAMQGSLINNNNTTTLRLLASMAANQLVGITVADPDNRGCYIVPVSNQTNCNSKVAHQFTSDWVSNIGTNFPDSTKYKPTVTVDANNIMTVVIQWKRTSDPSVRVYRATTQLKS